MRRIKWLIMLMLFLSSVPALAQAKTRALLVACSEFVTQPDLGSAISGNLHMIGSALISANLRLNDLSIEDGTIGTQQQLKTAVDDAFTGADENDLSILYLCTHGIISSSDDEQVYLLLGDGQTETPLSSRQLYELIADIQGEKLLILDACFSGALIGRGTPERGRLPGSIHTANSGYDASYASPFLADPSIHVITSADGYESSWYYDSENLSTGAVSYFASALSSGLGLYGSLEADLNGDGKVTLEEMQRYLSIAVPSSSSQLLSSGADSLELPVAQGASLSRPLSSFSYGTSLLMADDPTFDFSFTVTRDGTAVQYRLIDFNNGRWDWENATTFLDDGDDGTSVLSAGRKTRSLTLDDVSPEDSGYLMLQVFSVSGSEVILCSERLLAVQPVLSDALLTVVAGDTIAQPGTEELPIAVRLSVPAEITVSVFDGEGALVRRLASSQLTRPTPGNVAHLYWDGRDAEGNPVTQGQYTIAAEAWVGFSRQKATAGVTVGAGV